MDEDEKKAMLAEFIEKAKAAFVLEAKADIEKINKLIMDERKSHEDLLKGKLTEGDFKTYEAKSLEVETAIKARVDEIETKMNRLPMGDPEHKAVAPGVTEYKSAFYQFMRSGNLALDDTARKYNMERKALVSDATGQILIPEELESEIYRALPAINIIRGLATVRTITTDKIRRRSLTEVEVAYGKLELGAEAPETDAVPSEDWQYVEDMNGLTKVGKDELADTDTALESILLDSFSRKIAEKEEEKFILGAGHGSEEPEGILNGATVTRVLGAAIDVIATDDVLNLIYAVPAQYRRQGVLLFPSTTILALRKLKDAVSGQYMWQPSLQAGQPSSFAGFPVYAQENIPAIASVVSADIGIFGDFKAGYRILDRQGMTVQRLVELYAQAGLIGILVGARNSGGVIRPDALRILREPAA